ncbi:MAG: polyprenyl diphosphate synthase [Gemmatimonadota bacterium]|nr:polyprenyl diphosphate synthase [Gemmatimonadota bacterium]
MADSDRLNRVRAGTAVPSHVAVIMDGNGRWARERGFPRHLGHKEGMKSVREVIEGALEAGIDTLTLFAFSTDNWKRPAQEVGALMGLLRLYVKKECAELSSRGVEVHALGDLDRLDEKTLSAVQEMVERTRGGDVLRLNVMISYGGREELLKAAQALAGRVRAGELLPEQIDAEELEAALFTRGMSDPDLLIRTSGEHRISNFMLWQLAYTELHISPVYWPDFDREALFEAILDFQRRERRFGCVSVEVNQPQ